jgi:hypothetical protein
MPLSADHTVHLSRAWMLGQELARGRVSAWSDHWFFGFPLGELYPPLGDLLVNAVHALGFGAMEWPTAYALAFTLVFILQGWVLLRMGKALGVGPIPGLIAALLILADPGFSREGGWMYTVYFGVWPQVLATSLVWLGFAELGMHHAPKEGRSESGTRTVVRAALCFGASLLAHPMALMMLAMGAPLFIACVGTRRREGDATRLDTFRASVALLSSALLLGFALSAWWWIPMLAHKGWMASYGWLFRPITAMVHWALDGRWAQRMPAAVGYCAALGIGWAALRGNGFARFAACFALVQWSCASTDFFWDLRLDRISEGFTHLQYQRFLIAAKPGFFLAAGAAVGVPAHLGITMLRRADPIPRLVGTARRGAAGLCLMVAAAGLIWLAIDNQRAMREHEVGEIQLERLPGHTGFESDYADFLLWARDRWDEREQDYRIAFKDQRNLHWFMDSTPSTHTPLYKIGFTPGDNFVHKPESRNRELLDALGVRYLVLRSNRKRDFPGEVARFGEIRVTERRLPESPRRAWLRGEGVQGTVTLVEGSPREGKMSVEVEGLGGDAPELVFAIGGYPRWRSSTGEWHEVPVHGSGAALDPKMRAAGEVRGGKALGDDGTEPTLIATPLSEDGRVDLTYHRVDVRDLLATLSSVLALLALLLLRFNRGPLVRPNAKMVAALDRFRAAIARVSHPLILLALAFALTAVLGQRWVSNRGDESERAVGWMDDGAAVDARGVSLGPLKTDMLIRPAVLLKRSRDSQVTFRGVELDERLQGWIAVEDDMAKLEKRGELRVRIEARHGDSSWSTLLDMPVRHRPDRVPIDLTTGELAGQRVDLRVVAQKSGKRAPLIGFDLELGEAP